MANNRSSIPEEEFNEILHTRISLYHSQRKTISYREINNSINLNQDLRLNNGAYIAELFFINCIFNKEINIGAYHNAGNIVFDNCTFNENVIIGSYRNIELKNSCEFKKDLTISIGEKADTIISNLSIDNSLIIASWDVITLLSLNNINTKNAIQEQKIIVQAQCLKLNINNIHADQFEFASPGVIVKSSAIENLHCNRLSIKDIELNSLLSLKQSNIQIIEVDRISGSGKEFKISDNCIIDKVLLLLSQFQKVDFSNCTIRTIELIGSNEKDNILNIEKVTLDNLLFQKVYNNGLITLRQLNISSKGVISIKSSNLGKTDFINCDFSKTVMEFENSKVADVFLSESDFPRQVKNNGTINNSQAQLAFGQFNTAFQKQGDTIRAFEYQSREIEAHYNTLEKWFLPTFPFVDFNKINLWLNKWSNNFGRYWMRGMFFSFIAGLVFFYCLVISSDEYKIGFAFDFRPEFAQSFLKFMNPLRFFELENIFKKGDVHPWLTLKWSSYLWDFAGRVFVTYGFYQTIQAFRRFGRK